MNLTQTRLIRSRVVANSNYRRVVEPCAPRTILIGRRSIPFFVHWSFLLFVFTIPFEMANLAFTSGSFSLSKISGLLFFAFYFFYYNPLPGNRSFPRLPKAIYGFFGYMIVYVVNVFVLPAEFVAPFWMRFLTLIQLVALFWIVSGLLAEDKILVHFLFSYSLAASSLALGMMLRLPGLSTEIETSSGTRMTSGGFNPNTLAVFMALAVIMVVGLYLSGSFKGLKGKVLFGALLVPLIVAIVGTGSRGGIGVLAIGFSAYLMPSRWSRKKVSAYFLAILGIGALGYLAVTDPVAGSRWQAAFEGDTSGRQGIFATSVEMFLERPWFGWQPIQLWYELGTHVGLIGDMKDAHNLFLHLLLEVGLLGTIPFLVGLLLCTRAAWNARKGSFGLLPLALLLSSLVSNMTGTDLVRKPLWLVLALAVAAEASVLRGTIEKPKLSKQFA